MVAFSRLRPAILLFGDSITQFSFGEGPVRFGWGSLLAAAYQRRADVLNRGYSGYNTRHALDIVPKVFGAMNGGNGDDHLIFCTVFFGANDASLPGERQHIPIEEYRENLGKIITLIREHTKTSNSKNPFPIIIITPPPVDDKAWNEYLGLSEEFGRTNVVARKYGEEAKKVAKEMNCLALDAWELLGGDTDDYKKHLSDGLHLSESGEQILFDGLMSLIKKEHPDLAPQEYVDRQYQGPGMPVEGKLWDELC